MADVQIVDLDPKLSVDGTELIEIQDPAGGIGTSFKTPLSNLIGADGADGTPATVDVGATNTGAPGSSAAVVNSGTTQDAIFDFTIPRGDAGADGADGDPATVDAGSTNTGAPGSNASVVNSGTTQNAVFDFTIPRGDPGADGSDGADGEAATVAVGSTTTGIPGSNATVINSGTSSAAVFDFTIPRGDPGADGADGVGLPTGGTAGQVLVKNSATDYDTTWNTPAGGGDVLGPASAVNNNFAVFDGTTGKAIKDSGVSASDFATAAQGTLAGTAVQPGDGVSTLVNDAGYLDDGSLYASAAQGTLADSAVQPGDGISALVNDAGYLNDGSLYATSAQGLLADSAVQPGDGVSTLTNDAGYLDDGSLYATAAQGTLADSAVQPGDPISDLTNDASYISNTTATRFSGAGSEGFVPDPVTETGKFLSDNGTWTSPAGSGDVVGPASAVDSNFAAFDTTTGKLLKDSGSSPSDFATAAQGTLADSATQPGDNISTLTNDAGYRAYYSGTSLPDPSGYSEGDLFMVTT